MRTSLVLALSLLFVALAMRAPAAADLSGVYQGVGDAQAVFLELKHAAGALSGTLHFPDGTEGRLQGRTAADSATGVITAPNEPQAEFSAQFADEILRLRIREPGLVRVVTFLRLDAGMAEEDAAGPAPEAPDSLARFFVEENGVAIGPYSTAQMLERLQRGALAADQRVRRMDGLEWVRADSLPELQAAFPPPPPAAAPEPAP